MVPSATLSPKQAVWMRALDRATAEHIVVYRASASTLGVAMVAQGQWTEKPYTIAITGECCCDLACDCPAGRSGKLCKHVAAATFARKHHVYARQPQQAAPAFDPSYDLPPSLQTARAGLR